VDRGAALDLHADDGLGGLGKSRLDDRPAGRHGVEAIVARSPRARAGDFGQRVDHVEPPRSQRLQSVQDSGQLGLEHLAGAGLEVVRLAKLRHAGSVPVLPGRFGGRGRCGGVLLQHANLPPGGGEQHGHGQTDRPGADDDDWFSAH
jgi:hypothetical protein